MIVDKFVPEVYKESRDFKVFLKLFDMVVASNKFDIDNWIKLYDPKFCNSEFLQLLSDFVGYNFDTTLTTDETRIILSNFVSILKNRGSKLGFRQATSVALNAKLASDPTNDIYKEAVNQLQFLEIYFDDATGNITIYYPKDLSCAVKLYNYIRPVGTYLNLVLADYPQPESDVAVSARVNADKYRFNKTDDESSHVNESQVNLSQMSQKSNID